VTTYVTPPVLSKILASLFSFSFSFLFFLTQQSSCSISINKSFAFSGDHFAFEPEELLACPLLHPIVLNRLPWVGGLRAGADRDHAGSCIRERREGVWAKRGRVYLICGIL